MAASLCLFWTIWRQRNGVVFEDMVPSTQRMKNSLMFALWFWITTNSYASHECNRFFGHYVGVGLDCFFLFLWLVSLFFEALYTSCILSGSSLFL